jgi:hypothetical protein
VNQKRGGPTQTNSSKKQLKSQSVCANIDFEAG